jgi:anaerobic selenocysteine-containing dehydrogenase
VLPTAPPEEVPVPVPAPPADALRVHRACPLCEAKCGIEVVLDADRSRVLTVRGDPLDPMSRGYLCPKAFGLKGLQEDPDRVRRPLRRRGRGFEEVDWESAFAEAAERLRAVRDAHGADALATYLGNPNAHDMGSTFFLPAFQRALGTKRRFSATSVDQLPKMVSSWLLFGHPAAFAVPDVDRSDLLLVLGANPLASNGSLLTAPDLPGRLRRLRERGGRLVVVDPRRTETARLADRHLFIRPGADAYLLFALVHVLFAEARVRLGRLAEFTRGVDAVRELARDFAPERVAAATGIEAGTVRELAREFAAAPRAACYGRIGTCTQEFGTLASWLVDVVNVLTGNLDRPGGAMFPRPATGPAVVQPRRSERSYYGRWRSRVRGLPEFAGELPVAALAEEIDSAGEERVRALVTVAGNPVLSTPNGARLARALASLEFMVSIDIYVNETTRFAHLILPTTTPLERANYDVVFQALMVRNGAKWSPQVLEPPPDARQPWQVLAELAGRVNGTTAEAVDELVFGHLLASAVGPGTGCPQVTPEAARAQLGSQPGPERVLDLLLRAGPWGDRFAGGAGLSLARVRESAHGIDLGPLEPRLPELLATPSGAIELAPELAAADVERLREGLRARERAAGLVLVGRRHLRSNNSWMHNLEALAKGPERCTLLVHPLDAARLGLEPGGRAKVRSRVGEVLAPVAVSDEIMPGVVSLPHGFGHGGPGVRLAVARRHAGVCSNDLSDEAAIDRLSGNAVLNGIPVEVTAA